MRLKYRSISDCDNSQKAHRREESILYKQQENKRQEQGKTNMTHYHGTPGSDFMNPQDPDNDYMKGYEGNDFISGYFGNDTIEGGLGDDLEISGGDGNDILYGDNYDGGVGNDHIYGDAGNDSLIGGDGHDVLYGGDDLDTLRGGNGNDWYLLYHDADVIIEDASGGIDNVAISINYTLAANLENLSFTTNALKGTTGKGNNLDNRITGNWRNDILNGAEGNDSIDGGFGDDSIDGGFGNDSLIGGDGIESGNDYLNGRFGADTMVGGLGDDKYVVDNASDVVIEQLGEGTDTVISTINYTLGANVENLTLTESAIEGMGNDSKNYILGNAVKNVIYAQDGDDTVNGRGGDDFINGGTGNDTLYGDTENDTLLGATGNDLLSGGTGKDAFKFWNSNEEIDTIRDFAVADDLILVDNLGFSGGLTVGTLKAAQFHIGTSAQDSSDRFIYNQSTGSLYFDKDGIGGVAQTEFAKLSPGLAMTNQNIYVTSFII